jgi:lysophospholipase L1-like esterase
MPLPEARKSRLKLIVTVVATGVIIIGVNSLNRAASLSKKTSSTDGRVTADANLAPIGTTATLPGDIALVAPQAAVNNKASASKKAGSPKKSTGANAKPPKPNDPQTTRAVQSAPQTPATTQITTPARSAKGSKCVTTVMPLGDSLTAFAESYRGPLFRTLQKEGYNVDFVGSLKWEPVGGGDPDSEGHGGFRIGPDDGLDSEGKPANLAQNIDRWLDLSKPDVILLAIGTNDLSAAGKTADEAPARLRALVSHILATRPKTIVIVGDVVPNIYNVKESVSTKAVNASAAALGNASASDNIFYAPTFEGLLRAGFDPATGTNDGVHFTIEGGELYAKVWLPIVTSVLDQRGC